MRQLEASHLLQELDRAHSLSVVAGADHHHAVHLVADLDHYLVTEQHQSVITV